MPDTPGPIGTRGLIRARDAHEDTHKDERTETGDDPVDNEPSAERHLGRAAFLRERKEAGELRARVQPRRARAVRMRRQMRMRTFRW